MIKSNCCCAKVIRKDKGGQACLYCSSCGKWIKNANKDDLRALENLSVSSYLSPGEPKTKKDNVFVQEGMMVNSMSSVMVSRDPSMLDSLIPTEQLTNQLKDLVSYIDYAIKQEDEHYPLSTLDAARKGSKVFELSRVKNSLIMILEGRGINGGELWKS